MDKQELNKIIDEATLKEELALPIYADHIDNALFWAGLEKDKQEKIVSGLKILLKESLKHAEYLEKIKGLI